MDINTDPSRPAEIKEKMKETADTDHLASSATSSTSERDELAGPSPKIDTGLREMFSRFEAFNFDDDQQFQSGLAKIASLSGANRRKEQAPELLKVKVKAFYYSKTVEPIDFAAYMEWRQTQKRPQENQTSMSADHNHPPGEGNPGPRTPQHDTGCQLSCDAKSVAGETVCDTSCNLCNKAPDSQPQSDAQCERIQTDGQLSSAVPCQESSGHSSDATVTNSAKNSGVTTITINLEQVRTGMNQAGIHVKQTDIDKLNSGLNMNQTDSMDVNHTAAVINQTGMDEIQADPEEEHANEGIDCTVGSKGEKELSFAEVAELIQNGKPIPGLAQVEVVPTNMDPTPSRLHRTKKPWEE